MLNYFTKSRMVFTIPVQRLNWEDNLNFKKINKISFKFVYSFFFKTKSYLRKKYVVSFFKSNDNLKLKKLVVFNIT